MVASDDVVQELAKSGTTVIVPPGGCVVRESYTVPFHMAPSAVVCPVQGSPFSVPNDVKATLRVPPDAEGVLELEHAATTRTVNPARIALTRPAVLRPIVYRNSLPLPFA